MTDTDSKTSETSTSEGAPVESQPPVAIQTETANETANETVTEATTETESAAEAVNGKAEGAVSEPAPASESAPASDQADTLTVEVAA
ncbi:MAG: hypothetical protein DRH23_13050, partial [Deltaproteobacteria bacterium]